MRIKGFFAQILKWKRLLSIDWGQNVEKIKEFFNAHLVDVICIVAFVFFIIGCWCLYTADRTASDYHDVNRSVQQAQTDNHAARQQVGTAQSEIKSAQVELNRSIQRTDRSAKRINLAKSRTAENEKIIDDCQQLISAGRRDAQEAEDIFRSVDQQNKIPGTQTEGTP